MTPTRSRSPFTRACVAAIAISASAALAVEPTTRPRPATTRATSRPAATRPVAATRPAKAAEPLRDAIAVLFREGTDAAHAGKPFPRSNYDYLAGRTDLPELRLIDALGQRQSPEPHVDAYVKLNLISAFDRFDPANANAAIRAYALGAPTLAVYPSADAHERQDWERKIGQMMNSEAVDKVNEAFEAANEKVAANNEIMLAYRDALRAKIVAGDDATSVKLFAAQLEDLAQRSALGINTDKSLTALIKQIDAWSARANRASLRQMQQAANEYAARKSPPIVFTKMTWNEKTRKARWGEREAALDDAKLKKLIDTLKEREEATK